MTARCDVCGCTRTPVGSGWAVRIRVEGRMSWVNSFVIGGHAPARPGRDTWEALDEAMTVCRRWRDFSPVLVRVRFFTVTPERKVKQ